MDILDILLRNEIPEDDIKEYKIKRLSELYKADVIIKLKPLTYSKIMEIKETGNDMQIHIILGGDCEGLFKNKELMEKYSAATPAELVKKILKPGEINSISNEILSLSGYNKNMIEVVKKK